MPSALLAMSVSSCHTLSRSAIPALAVLAHVEAALLFKTLVSGVELLPATIAAMGLMVRDSVEPQPAIAAGSNKGNLATGALIQHPKHKTLRSKARRQASC